MTELKGQCPAHRGESNGSDSYVWSSTKGVGKCWSCDLRTWEYNGELYGKYGSSGKPFVISGSHEEGLGYTEDPLDKLIEEKKFNKEATQVSEWKYEGTRGINTQTMEYYGVKKYLGVKWGAKIKGVYEEGTSDEYRFPYICGGYKIRRFDLPKKHGAHFSAVNLKSNSLFGMNLFPKGCAPKLTVTEGECFTPDAEVLTKEGWVSFENYSGQQVAQVHEDLSVDFTYPVAVVDKEFTGNLIEYRSGSYYSLTTPDHNLVRINPKGDVKKVKASKNSTFVIPRGFDVTTESTSLSLLELRAWIMLSADFSFRKEGDLYANFKKERKVERAKEILDTLGVRYSCNKVSNGYWSVFVHRGHGIKAEKNLPWELIYHKDKHEILKEVIFWDGNYVKTRNQAEFATNRKHNADVVQALAHSCGYVSTIIHRSNDFGKWMKVSILFGKKHSSTQGGYNEVPYSGRVMCLQVPTGMLVVRQKDSVSISGNCDAMAAYQMLNKGTYLNPVVSVPSANPSASFWESTKEYFDSFNQIILSVDNDEAGKALRDKFIKIYPEKTYIVEHGKYKDANEILINGEEDYYFKSWRFAKKYKPDYILSESDDFIKMYDESPELEFFPTGIPDLDSKLGGGISKGYITLIQAKTGVGKTQLVRMFEYSCLKNSDFKLATKHLEETHKESILGLVSYDLNERLIDKSEIEQKGKTEEVKESIKRLTKDGRLIFYDLDPSDTNDDIIKKFRYLINAMEVDYIFLEPVQDAVAGSNASEKEGRLSDLVSRMGSLCGETGVGFVVIAHENSDGGAMYSSMITKKAGFKITLSANRESEDLTERNKTYIKVEEKNRSAKGFGNAGIVEFDYDTYTLKPIVKEEPKVPDSNGGF